MRGLYSSNHAPEMSRSTLKKFLNLAVTNIFFIRNDGEFYQVDGLAMGASLAVTLAKIWMHIRSSDQRKRSSQIVNKIPKNYIEACLEYNRRVTYRAKAYIKNVRIGSMENAKTLMINCTPK